MEPKISKITILSAHAHLLMLVLWLFSLPSCLCLSACAYIEVKTRFKDSTRLEQEQQHWIDLLIVRYCSWAFRFSVLVSYANAKLMDE